MKQVKTRAILLRRLNYGEADRILTAITPDHGKVSLLAKGVRKSQSKLAGGIELLSVSDITFIEGKSELKTLISTRLHRHFHNIVENVDSTMLAYELIKTIDKATHTEAEEGTFELAETALESLDDKSVDDSIVMVWFTIRLLRLEGGGINLEKPLNASKFSDQERYEFDYDDRSFAVSKEGSFGPNVIKFLRLCARSSQPAQLQAVQQAPELATNFHDTAMTLLEISRV